MARDFNITIPLSKAGIDDKGQVWVHGVASDESIDLQREITKAAGLKPGLPYLRRFGKFNDDHKDDVGEVMVADVVTMGELVKRGVLAADQVTKSQAGEEVLYVAGPLYDKVQRAQYYREVLESDGRLGFSIQGAVLDQKPLQKAGSTIKVNHTCFINKIAITDQPVNPNTWCSLKKSFGGCTSDFASDMIRAISKALETGQGVVAEGDTGGAALRTQQLKGARRKGRRARKREAMMKTNGEHEYELLATDIEKSFGGLSADDVSQQVYSAINPRPESSEPAISVSSYVAALYDNHVVVRRGNKFTDHSFTVKDGKITLGEGKSVHKEEKWVPDGEETKKSLEEPKTLLIGELNSPSRILKAWSELTNPVALDGIEEPQIEEAMKSVHAAAKSFGLSYGIEQDRQGATLLKGLAETDLMTLTRLESMSDEDFGARIAEDIEALRKSRAAKEPEKKEAEPEKKPADEKPKAEDKKEDDEETDIDKMSLKQLQAYARSNSIDIEGLDDADDIRDAIEEAEEGGGEDKAAKKSLESEEADTPELPELPENVIDVTKYFAQHTEEVSKGLGNVQESMQALPESMASGMSKALAPFLEQMETISKSLAPLTDRMEAIEKSIAEQQAELAEMGRRPAPAGAYAVVEKSFGGDAISGAEATNIIQAAIRKNLCPTETMAEFELNKSAFSQAKLAQLKQAVSAQ